MTTLSSLGIHVSRGNKASKAVSQECDEDDCDCDCDCKSDCDCDCDCTDWELHQQEEAAAEEAAEAGKS